jgi:DNA sulfur modification protein DndB
MNLVEIGKRVHYAQDIHKSQQLSGMIQRQLKKGRSAQISSYLKNQPERFFNSLVVATYGGQPNWRAISSVKSKSANDEFGALEPETLESVGFLTLRGDENLFALDGQHRLSGIKKAIADGLEQDPVDEVSVIFVAHKVNPKGLERTRRLFTTLNKTAKPVSKGDIIALDEDDVMAICVRRLIEETELFSGNRIAFTASNNMPSTNTASLTTIGNLYDILTLLFTEEHSNLRKPKSELLKARPEDEELDAYFQFARKYFGVVRKNFTEIEEFFAAKEPQVIVKKYRGSHGGKAIFRPLGLEIYTRIISRLTKQMSRDDAVKITAKLPRDLTDAPFRGLMWDSNNNTISNAHKVTLREVLLYMTGCSKFSDATLLARYRKELGDEKAALPDKVV